MDARQLLSDVAAFEAQLQQKYQTDKIKLSVNGMEKSMQEICKAVMDATGIDEHTLAAKGKKASIALARNCLIYLVHITGSKKAKRELQDFLNRDRTTLTKNRQRFAGYVDYGDQDACYLVNKVNTILHANTY